MKKLTGSTILAVNVILTVLRGKAQTLKAKMAFEKSVCS